MSQQTTSAATHPSLQMASISTISAASNRAFIPARSYKFLPFVEAPLELCLLRHPGFGITDGGFDMRWRNDDDAIRVPDDQVARVDSRAGHDDWNINGAGPAFAGIGHRAHARRTPETPSR